jgi:hypothetical protein
MKTIIGRDLFDTPLTKTKVRNGVYAYKYRNGVININGSRYLMMTVKEAISIWRRNNPKN